MADSYASAYVPPPAPVADTSAAPTQPQGDVNVIDPNGDVGTVPAEQLQTALSQGYKQASDDDIKAYDQQKEYSTPGQQALAAVEGAAEGATFGGSTALETGLGIAKPEEIRGRAEANPGSHILGQAASLAIPGAPEAEALEGAGKAATGLLGLAEPTTTIARIGSSAVKGAVENAMVQGGDEVSRMISQDPDTSVQTAIPSMGLAGLIGGGIGGTLGAVSPLWEATIGNKLNTFLKGLSDHLGGKADVIPGDISQALNVAGIDVPPEVRAMMSNDPGIREAASRLAQSDTTASGQKFQQAIKDFRENLANSAAETLGAKAEDLPALENQSVYQTGKDIGETLADEYKAKLDPLSNSFEDLKGKYKDAPLVPDREVSSEGRIDTGNPYKPMEIPPLKLPGTATTIAQQLTDLAGKEGWIGAKNDIENEFNRVLTKLPKMSKLSDVSELMTQIGNNTKSTLPFGMQTPLSRAGQMMKSVLSDAEDGLARQTLGEKAPELISQFDAARQGYKGLAALKEGLNDRLKVGGSVSGFAKGLKEMANTDGESIARRLSGKGDAQLLDFLNKNFPETAAKVRQMHLDGLLKQAAGKASGNEALNLNTLTKAVEGMSPELKQFVLSSGQSDKISAIQKIMEAYKDPTHNFSNTARTIDKLSKDMPAAAVSAIAALAGHNPVAGFMIGKVASIIGKDAPDAIRLSLLKFLGSNEPIQAQGFKSAVDYLHHVVSGEALVTKAAKNIFKAGKEVLPQAVMPKESDRNKLQKGLQALNQDASPLLGVGGKSTYYLPEHGQAIGSLANNAVQYLNSIKPNTQKQSPLDPPTEPNVVQKDAWNKALDIANQPLVVLKHVKEGSVTPQDIATLQHLYPSLYTKLSQQISNEMANVADKGETVPYHTRLGLSLFLGQPLDSTMTPMSIQAAQPQPAGQPPSGQPQAPVKHKTAALNKFAGIYKTPGQAAEQDKAEKA